jgi:hypothetical protein
MTMIRFRDTIENAEYKKSIDVEEVLESLGWLFDFPAKAPAPSCSP